MTENKKETIALQEENQSLKEQVAALKARVQAKDDMIRELQEHEARFNRMVENVNGMVYRCANDPSWTMEYVSIGAKALTGYEPAQLTGECRVFYGRLIHPEDQQMVAEVIRTAVAEKLPFRLTYRIIDARGREKWVWEQGMGIWDPFGKLTALEGYITDISDIKEAESYYRSLFENNHAAMLLIDPEDGAIVNANPVATTFYGWPKETLIGKKILAINTANPEQIRMKMATAEAEKRSHFVFQHRLADGSLRDVEVYSGPIQMGGRRLLYSIIHDITQRLQTERALLESENRFRLAFDASPDAINLNRLQDGLYVDINEGFARITGFTRKDVIGKTSLEINVWKNPADRKELVKVLLEKGYCENLEAEFYKKDGTFTTGLMSARVISINDEPHIISITRDMTDRVEAEKTQKKLEDQLHQAQRLESIGRLAGGISHDFNNLLSIILGYVELMIEDLGSAHPHGTLLKEIHSATLRARDLTRQLLAFGRKQIMSMAPVDVNKVIQDFKSLISRVIGEDITLGLILSHGSLTVQADIPQLEQVLMNLAVNARDAMVYGGIMTISTAAVTIEEAGKEDTNPIAPGDYARITVSDTGTGMEQDMLESIFEPFFTTKDKDKGTGLGLAMVYGIVKQHDGYIMVDSKPNRGTTFSIHLPLCSQEVAEPSQMKTDPRPAPVFDSPTILIIEDDPAVRQLAGDILKRNGYRVIRSDSVDDAIAQSEKHAGPIHLVLSDVIMQGMKGPEVFALIKKARPKTRVLYMSGYTDNVTIGQGAVKEGVDFIQKPFTVSNLLAKVDAVLQRSTGW